MSILTFLLVSNILKTRGAPAQFETSLWFLTSLTMSLFISVNSDPRSFRRVFSAKKRPLSSLAKFFEARKCFAFCFYFSILLSFSTFSIL